MPVTLAEWLQPSKVSQTISWPGPGLSAPQGGRGTAASTGLEQRPAWGKQVFTAKQNGEVLEEVSWT